MKPFTRLCGTTAPLLEPNIDSGRMGDTQWCRDHPDDLGPALMRDQRFDASGNEIPDFMLNQPRYRKSEILLAGPNFGCGSSRETAVWSLLAFGIRCVIAPSFGEIFRDNAYQNGLLPVVLKQEIVEQIGKMIRKANDPSICVDLESCTIEVPGLKPIKFDLPPDRRLMLLEGLDETQLIGRSEAAIAAFEQRDRAERPWVYTDRAKT